jgi:hypothetical protein
LRWIVATVLRAQAVGVEHFRALARDRQEGAHGVVHRVADVQRALREALAREVAHRRRRRAQQQIGGVIGEDAVVLLGHRAVPRAQPGLDVGEPQLALLGRERAAQRRVRVAVHDHPVGLRVAQHLFASP